MTCHTCSKREWLWVPAFAGTTTYFRRDDDGVWPCDLCLATSHSHRRQHLVAAIVRVKFSAALPLDRRTAGGGRGVGGDAEGAAQSVGTLAGLARGKGGAGGADADHQKCGGGDFDRQSHGAFLP